MKNEHKEILLNLIVLAAVAIAIVSLFVPIIGVDYSDIEKNMGIEDFSYVKTYYGPLTAHIIVSDSLESDDAHEYHTYWFFGFFKFETGTPIEYESAHLKNPYDFYITASNNYLYLLFVSFFMGMSIYPFLFIYFSYRGIQNIDIKKTKYFLYLGIVNLISLISFLIGGYFLVNSFDVNNVGYVNFITFQYGFYLVITSVILFFLSYIMQNYFIDYSEKKSS